MSAIEDLACPDCGGRMVSRMRRPTAQFGQSEGQRFFGCSSYPQCKGTRDTDGRSKAERSQDHAAMDDEHERAELRRKWHR